MKSFDTYKCDVLYGNILFCKKNDKKNLLENGSVDLLKKKI